MKLIELFVRVVECSPQFIFLNYFPNFLRINLSIKFNVDWSTYLTDSHVASFVVFEGFFMLFEDEGLEDGRVRTVGLVLTLTMRSRSLSLRYFM